MPRQFTPPGGAPAAPADNQPEQEVMGGPSITIPKEGDAHLLAYDTETTGLPEFSKPSDDPNQPHIVQLAAVLVDIPTRKTVAAIDLIIRPEGWEIPEEASKIHGITTEHALKVGVPESLALALFCAMWSAAEFRVAHNESFDARIVRIGLKRYASLLGLDPDLWKQAPAKCTQAMSTPILKLPPTAKMIKAGRNHHKSANLGEAFKFFTGQELVGAHTAMVDVLACMEVYFAIKDRSLNS